MDLTVRRFRQITAAIQRRQFMDRRQQISMLSWQTRQIVTYVAGGYMTDGNSNPALDSAQQLAFDEIEKSQIEEAYNLHTGANGIKYDSKGNIIPELPVRLQSEAKVLNAFGDPSKWRSKG